jgi:dehydrogenase/reductase SDR family protein 7B
MNFSHKTIWITGASSGIGEALVHAFAQQGANIILSARRQSELERVKQECMHLANIPDERFFVLPLDLADSASLPAKTAQALAWKGSVDVMLHNGGVSQRSLAKDTTLEVDRRIMEVDYFGTVALTKALLPSFLERKVGHFVVVSSLVGMFGTPMRSSYSAAKHALHGFFDALRAETHDEGLLVTMICPGFIKTQVSVNALRGDGSAQRLMDDAQANGMDAGVCARRIVKAVAAKKLEVYIGGRETLGVYLKRFVPRVFARVLRRAKVT